MKKRSFAGILAAAMVMNTLLAVPFTTNAMETVKVEAEDAGNTLENDAKVEKAQSGYSGDGYVHLEDNSQTTPTITFKVDIPEAGKYEIRFGYMAPYGTKRGTVSVNGEQQGEAVFEESEAFGEVSFGKAEFKKGENTITLASTWGYTIIDYVTVGDYVAPERPAITASHKALSDPDATDGAKQIYSYLHSVYGEHILSGQQEIYKYGPHDIETEFNYIKDKTGKLPAIRGFDYGNFCCPAFGSDDGSTERVLAWAEQGGLCTASFHLNVPTDFASYTIGDKIAWDQTTYSQKTDFSPAKAATEGTKENQYYTQALDTLCEEFAKLQDKGVTILWRPLHEAEGGGGENGSWFWWGREGSAAYRQLYQYTYKYMTGKGLHNLIWEWNSYDYSSSANWYPGDAYVDIIGYDKYNCTDWSTGKAVVYHNTNPETDIFYNMMARYGNTKMVALMECDSFSTLSEITSEKAGWLYFMPWYDGGSDDTNFLSNPMFNTEEDLIEMYQSDYCITLDELPDFTKIEVTDETNEIVNTEPAEKKEGHADIVTDAKGVTTVDFPKASDTVVLDVDVTKAASGGLGTSIEYNGKYYWVNVTWAADKSGQVEVVLKDNVLNVTEGPDPVEDEAIVKAVIDKVSEQKSFQFQVWEGDATLTDAWIKESGEKDPEEPSEEPTEEPTEEPSETPTEKPSEEPADLGTCEYKLSDLEKDADGNLIIPIEVAGDIDKIVITGTIDCDADASWYCGGGGLCFSNLTDETGDTFWGFKSFQFNKGDKEAVVKFDGKFTKPGETDADNEDVNATYADDQILFQDWWKASETDKDGADVTLTYDTITVYYKEAAEVPSEEPTDKPTDQPTEEPTDEPSETPSEDLPAVTKYGDVVVDDVVDIIDVIALNKYLLGVNKLEAQSKANADVDNSGKLDSTDSLNILKNVVELIDLPVK